MPHSRTKHTRRLDPRNPLVFDTRDLGPGMARTLSRSIAAPEHLGVEMARVPAGADITLELQLEGVAEGVLVTAEVTAPLAGECARCLEPFAGTTQVRLQELFRLEALAAEDGESGGEESYLVDASGQLDLEPALRDAVVLELPLSPLCAEDCEGLCVECGVRLAEAEPGHRHEERGTMWAALKDYQASAAGSDEVPDGTAGPETTRNRADSRPAHTKER